MRTYYTLSDGTKLEIFMWSDFLSNKLFRDCAEVTPIHNNRRGQECKKWVFQDKKGIFIIWDEQKVYLNDFDYEPISAVIQRIEQNDKWLISDDEILATFLKDTENVGIVIDLPQYDMICPELDIGFTGNKEHTVLCIPTERQYKKEEWGYKITVECEDEALRQYIPCKHFYFSDFCSLLEAGTIKLVDKQEYKNNRKKV